MESLTADMSNLESDYKFENKEEFEILVISPNNIESYDYNNPGYVTKLVNENFNKIIKVNPENFMEKIAINFNIDSFDPEDRNIVTQVFYDKPEYFYEILFLDVRTKENKVPKNENQFASMINTQGEKIYGNAIIMKTFIPNDNDKSMVFSNMTQTDLFDIIDSRANTKVIVYEDGEYREEVVRGDMDVFCKNLFEEEFFKKKEILFLYHNLNIWYSPSEYGTEISEKLVSGKVECAVFFSMICEEYRGNITLDEVKKIVELSKSLENFGLQKRWIEEEKDDLDRKIIKNKYKVLEYAWREHNKKD
jgi:hypothetical protein|tara:strand:- start:4 stop:921 length:918 start_codon:yes stop_codon:yes gene_type:complete